MAGFSNAFKPLYCAYFIVICCTACAINCGSASTLTPRAENAKPAAINHFFKRALAITTPPHDLVWERG